MLFVFALIIDSSATFVIPCGAAYSSTSSSSFSVSQCYFYGLAGIDGGAISITGSSSILNINSSMFRGCTSTDTGGALYFTGINLSISQTCAIECRTVQVGQFFFAYTSSSGYVALLDVSYCLCDNISSGKDYTNAIFYASNSTTTCANSSFNKVSIYGCGQMFQDVDIASLSFLSQINGSAGTSIAVYFNGVTSGTMSYSNAVNNNAIGVVSFGSSSTAVNITECVFIGNTQSPLFYVFNQAGNYSVQNCWIAHSGTIAGSGVSTTNCAIGTAHSFFFNIGSFTVSSAVCYFPNTYSTNPFTSSISMDNVCTGIIAIIFLLVY